MNTLTVGMAVYDDYDGVYFSIGAIMMSPLRDIVREIVVVDNNPTSKQGKATKKLLHKNYKHCSIKFRYKTFTERRSTSVRTEIFKHSTSDYTLVIDSHVILNSVTVIDNMKKFLARPLSCDLFHGLLLRENGNFGATELLPVWCEKGQFYGKWHLNNVVHTDCITPFKIHMSGLGLFMCATKHWLGLSKHTVGWGGEEGYIHQKYKNAGRDVYCLPWLQWIHRFARPDGVPFSLAKEERVYNYAVCWKEVGLDMEELRAFFIKVYPNMEDKIIEIVDRVIATPLT